MTYHLPHVVVETRHFIARCKQVAMSDMERDLAVLHIASNPTAGDLLPGGHGIRKIRASYGGKGKSGGVRIIYYYGPPHAPIYLLDVYGKNDQDNLSQAEVRELGRLALDLAQRHRKGGHHG